MTSIRNTIVVMLALVTAGLAQTPPPPGPGQVTRPLVYNPAINNWVPLSFPLLVTTTIPDGYGTVSRLLYWNPDSSKWLPWTGAGSGGGSDTTLRGRLVGNVAPVLGQVLGWNGTAWVPLSGIAGDTSLFAWHAQLADTADVSAWADSAGSADTAGFAWRADTANFLKGSIDSAEWADTSGFARKADTLGGVFWVNKSDSTLYGNMLADTTVYNLNTWRYTTSILDEYGYARVANSLGAAPGRTIAWTIPPQSQVYLPWRTKLRLVEDADENRGLVLGIGRLKTVWVSFPFPGRWEWRSEVVDSIMGTDTTGVWFDKFPVRFFSGIRANSIFSERYDTDEAGRYFAGDISTYRGIAMFGGWKNPPTYGIETWGVPNVGLYSWNGAVNLLSDQDSGVVFLSANGPHWPSPDSLWIKVRPDSAIIDANRPMRVGGISGTYFPVRDSGQVAKRDAYILHLPNADFDYYFREPTTAFDSLLYIQGKVDTTLHDDGLGTPIIDRYGKIVQFGAYNPTNRLQRVFDVSGEIFLPWRLGVRLSSGFAGGAEAEDTIFIAASRWSRILYDPPGPPPEYWCNKWESKNLMTITQDSIRFNVPLGGLENLNLAGLSFWDRTGTYSGANTILAANTSLLPSGTPAWGIGDMSGTYRALGLYNLVAGIDLYSNIDSGTVFFSHDHNTWTETACSLRVRTTQDSCLVESNKPMRVRGLGGTYFPVRDSGQVAVRDSTLQKVSIVSTTAGDSVITYTGEDSTLIVLSINGIQGRLIYNNGVLCFDRGDKFYFGTGAGVGATGAYNANFFGPYAGFGATDAYDANFCGAEAGYNAPNAHSSNFFGPSAGNSASYAENANFFGLSAGYGATNAYNANFIGPYAGYNATDANNSNFFGPFAGTSATNASGANFYGSYAGHNAISAYNANFYGSYAGYDATDANNSNFFGSYAGHSASNAYNANFFGSYAGYNAVDAYNSNFFGPYAGFGATNAKHSIGIGYYTLMGATSPGHVMAFGDSAGIGTARTHAVMFGRKAQADADSQFFIGGDLKNLKLGVSGSTVTADTFKATKMLVTGKVGPGLVDAFVSLAKSGRKLTTTERNALSAEEGDIVYDLDLHRYYYWNGTGWVEF